MGCTFLFASTQPSPATLVKLVSDHWNVPLLQLCDTKHTSGLRARTVPTTTLRPQQQQARTLRWWRSSISRRFSASRGQMETTSNVKSTSAPCTDWSCLVLARYATRVFGHIVVIMLITILSGCDYAGRERCCPRLWQAEAHGLSRRCLLSCVLPFSCPLTPYNSGHQREC
jgi:hypothetical protein